MQDDGDLILEVDIDDFGNEVRDSSVNEKLIDFVVNLKAEQGFKKKKWGFGKVFRVFCFRYRF